MAHKKVKQMIRQYDGYKITLLARESPTTLSKYPIVLYLTSDFPDCDAEEIFTTLIRAFMFELEEAKLEKMRFKIKEMKNGPSKEKQ